MHVCVLAGGLSPKTGRRKCMGHQGDVSGLVAMHRQLQPLVAVVGVLVAGSQACGVMHMTRMLCVVCVSLQAARLHKRWVDVQGEVARTVAAYDAATSGPTKWPRLTAFLQQQYGHMVADFVQRCEAEADKKVGVVHGRGGEGWELLFGRGIVGGASRQQLGCVHGQAFHSAQGVLVMLVHCDN